MSAAVQESSAEQIFRYAVRLATPFQSQDGQACASVPLGIDTHVVWPIESPQFRDWLADGFYREHDRFPSRNQLLEAIQLLVAQAHHSDFPRQVVDLRVSYRGERFAPSAILLDLANARGEAVEITPQGWTVTPGRHFFRRVPGMESLPAPNPSAAADWPIPLGPRLFAWLTEALRPAGPYRALALSGPAGNGKTTAARMLRACIDPGKPLLCPFPETEAELRALAWNNRVLVFDHVTAVPARIAAGLRRLCSGDLERPIILTIPVDQISRCRSLFSEVIVAELSALENEQRLSQAQLWRTFENARAGLLASVCDGVSAAMGVAMVAAPASFS